MKNLVLFLMLCSNLLIAQNERSEKLGKKFNSTPTTTTNSSERSEKVTNRNNTYRTQTYETPRNTYQRPIIYNGFDYNWVRWGAPYNDFLFYTPSFYYDRFGFRQPMRIYQMSDGNKKIVNGEKMNYRIGVGYGFKDNLSFWASVGKRNFFMVEYSTILESDKSSFMSNVTMDDVIRWQDERLEDIRYGGTIYMGAGRKFSKFGAYVMGGYGWETHNLQFFDELYVLSNNGRYSIRDYNEKYFTAKLGAIYDHKYISLKTDYDLFRNIFNVGFGITL
jgi:hypothetical protein